MSAAAGLLPARFGIRLDAGTRCSADGRTLIGGSPMRRLRLSVPAANLLANLRAGEPATSRPARQLAGGCARREWRTRYRHRAAPNLPR